MDCAATSGLASLFADRGRQIVVMEEVSTMFVENVRSGMLHVAKGQRLMCNGREVDDSSFKKVECVPPDAMKCQTCFKERGAEVAEPDSPTVNSPTSTPEETASPMTPPQFLASGQQVDVSAVTMCPIYELRWETVNWQSLVKFLSLDAVRAVPRLFDALASIAERTVALNALHVGKIPVAGFVGPAPPGLRGVPRSGVVELPSGMDAATPSLGDSSQTAKKLKNAPNLGKVWGELPKQVQAELVNVQMDLAGTSLVDHSDLVQAIAQADLGLSVFQLQAGALSSLRHGLEHKKLGTVPPTLLELTDHYH